MKNNYIVYVHINKVNLKVYVGQTCQGLNRRCRNGQGYLNNKSNVNRTTHFANAIQKYGWNNFEHIILEDNLTKNQADFYEKLYIKAFKSFDSNFGYNETLGGDGVRATDNVKLKMSTNHANVKGEHNPMYGKNIKDFMSEIDYLKWRENLNNFASTHKRGKSNSAKAVYCFELDKSFDCVTDAAEFVNIRVSILSSHLHNRTKYAGIDVNTGKHLHWCFLSDRDKMTVPEQENKMMGKFHPTSRKLYCYELDEVFYGVGEIQRKYTFNTKHITDCLNGLRPSCGKHPLTGKPLHWCFYKDKDTFVPASDEKSKNLGKYHHSAKAIYCIELDEIFDTAVEAYNKYGFSKVHIRDVCKGLRNVCGTHPITNEKLHWLYISDAKEKGYI